MRNKVLSPQILLTLLHAQLYFGIFFPPPVLFFNSEKPLHTAWKYSHTVSPLHTPYPTPWLQVHGLLLSVPPNIIGIVLDSPTGLCLCLQTPSSLILIPKQQLASSHLPCCSWFPTPNKVINITGYQHPPTWHCNALCESFLWKPINQRGCLSKVYNNFNSASYWLITLNKLFFLVSLSKSKQE